MTGRAISLLCVVTAMVVSTTQRPAAQAGAQIPRTPDGKPNFSGVWQAMNTAAWDIQDHHADLVPGLPIQFSMPGGRGVVEANELPYLPEALARKKENFANRMTLDPETKCFLPGVPRIMYMPFPFEIVQSPRQVTMLFEYVHATRNVYMSSEHLKGPIEWWLGDSRGTWEGDTLAVSVRHFNGRPWLDRAGNFLSEDAQLVERFSFITPDHLNYEVTVTDPKVYSRPWKMSMPLYRRKEANAQLLDFDCFAFGENGALSFGPR